MGPEKLLKKDVFLFLKQNKTAVISTVSADNTAESAMIYYGVDNDFNFYFVTGEKTRKYANLMRNSRASLVIADEYQLKTLQIEGETEELYRVKKNSKAVKLLTEALSPTITQTIAYIWDPIPPIMKMNVGSICIFKLKPKWMRWADFSESVEKTKGYYFKLIIP